MNLKRPRKKDREGIKKRNGLEERESDSVLEKKGNKEERERESLFYYQSSI